MGGWGQAPGQAQSPGMKPMATQLMKQREDTSAPGSLVCPRLSVVPGELYSTPMGPEPLPSPRPFLWLLGSPGLDLGPSRANFQFPSKSLSLCLEVWALYRGHSASTSSLRQGTQNPLTHHPPDNNHLFSTQWDNKHHQYNNPVKHAFHVTEETEARHFSPLRSEKASSGSQLLRNKVLPTKSQASSG